MIIERQLLFIILCESCNAYCYRLTAYRIYFAHNHCNRYIKMPVCYLCIFKFSKFYANDYLDHGIHHPGSERQVVSAR